MANSIGNKLSSLNRGAIIGGVLGVLYIVYAFSESGRNLFDEETSFMFIMDFSIILGSALSGFIIDKYIINSLVPKSKWLESHRIGSIVLCLVGGILFFLPALVLGVYGGGLLGGFVGSTILGDYGGVIGGFIFITLFIMVIPIIGALIGSFLGAFMESLIRVFLRVGKVVK